MTISTPRQRAAAACTAEGCSDPQYTRQLCLMHYKRDYRARRKAANGSVGHAPSRPAIDRLLAKFVEIPGPLDTPCWGWKRRLDRYTTINVDGKNQLAHRVAYEHFVAPIPDGYEVDHLCRVPACCNPVHLEAVTPRENKIRSMAPSAIAYRTNRCKWGHSLEDARTNDLGHRHCRTCQRLRDAKRIGGHR